ncbi:MAG: MBL fold metallo-hydrolase [Deltaproteobacteria bacterium]|nr:MBL fold metallo-hydrolase [Deltaproteobacteria bacterium]
MSGLQRRALVMFCLGLGLAGCSVVHRVMERNGRALGERPRRAPGRRADPRVRGASLAITWVGHATTLIQLGDRYLLTDPVFTETVGQFSRRLVEPGIDAPDLPRIDGAVLSHLHFDHLSLGSLDLLEPTLGRLWVPPEALVYLPRYSFPIREVEPWHTELQDNLRITAVPVRHQGWRYGVDAAWMKRSYSGWVIQDEHHTVYFGGDTAYDPAIFAATKAHFPRIDVALLPIAPVEPPELTRPTHLDGAEAVQAFLDLGAQVMIPIHYDTFAHGIDPPGYAIQALRRAMQAKGLTPERVQILEVGETWVQAQPPRLVRTTSLAPVDGLVEAP